MLSANHWRPELANTVMLKGNAEPRLCIYTIDQFAKRKKLLQCVKETIITCTQQKPICIPHWVLPWLLLHHGCEQPHRAASGWGVHSNSRLGEWSCSVRCTVFNGFTLWRVLIRFKDRQSCNNTRFLKAPSYRFFLIWLVSGFHCLK